MANNSEAMVPMGLLNDANMGISAVRSWGQDKKSLHSNRECSSKT